MAEIRDEIVAREPEDFAAERPKRAPAHPGAIIKNRVLPSLNNMSVAEAAEHINVTRQQLYRVISGESAISPDMAVRLGKFCGNGPEMWLRMQTAYDLWHAQQRLQDEVEKIPTMEAGKRAA